MPENFFRDGEHYVFKTVWHNIVTRWGQLTYYALYLPKYAVPTEIHFTDPHLKGKEYTRNVFRDDQKKRFVLYVECSSSRGNFSFDTFVKFHHDDQNFANANYSDKHTVCFYKHLKAEHYISREEDRQSVNNFFIKAEQYNPNFGDTYNVRQAGAVGPGASASNNTLSQQIDP